MRIHQKTIDEIQNRIQIEEIIEGYVSLKKKGKDLWGLCPFHHEKTPSFSIAPKLGFYKCFGCDAKGDAINFLMQHHSISYIEALHMLAEKYGIPIEQATDPASHSHEKKVEDTLYTLLATTQNFYEEELSHKPHAQHARTYLAQRGINTSLIKKFHLGYSPNQWKALYTYATEKSYEVDTLKKAGLVIQKENNTYDRFRNRIIFPIHNLANQVIGFGARRLDNNDQTPKYINSPETPIYKKSQVLYGLYQAKKTIKEKNFAYLVEGYTDVLALHREGLSNVVASSGTSLTQSQIRLLSKFTKNITLLFDNDTAGSEATLRSINLLLAQGLDVKVVSLPIGEDPDSYARQKGTEAFLHYLQTQNQDFITFKTQTLLKKSKPNDLQAKQLVIQAMVETLAIIPDLIKRTLYTQLSSKLLDLPQATLATAISHFEKKHTSYTYKKNTIEKPTTPSLNSPKERTTLYILLHYSTHPLDENKTCGTYLIEELDENLFIVPRYKTLFQKFKHQWQQNNYLTAKDFIQHQPQEIKKIAIEVMSNPYSLGEWEKYYQINVPKEHENLTQWCFKSVQHLRLHQAQQLLSNNLKALQRSTSDQEVDKLLATHQTLQKTTQEIAKTLTIVVTSTSRKT